MKEINEDKIDLRRYFDALKKGWYWFAIAAVMLFGLAGFYWVYGYPKYTSYSSMLIENTDDGGGGALSAASALSGGASGLLKSFSIGGFGASNADNELVLARAFSQFKETSSRLKLNRTYIEKDGITRNILYNCSPVILEAPKEVFDTLKVGFKVKVQLKNGKISAKAQRGFLGRKLIGEVNNQTLPCALKTTMGTFQLLATNDYKPNEERNITIVVSGDEAIASGLQTENVDIQCGKLDDGLAFMIDDISQERGQDILNMLMALYNERRINRKNETAREQVDFVEGRLNELAGELEKSEKAVEKFKSDNLITDIEAEAGVLISQGAENRKAIVEAHGQITILDMMHKFLSNPENKYKMIPMSESLGDQGASQALNDYNELINKKISIERSAKGENVALQNIKDQIDAARNNVLTSISRMKDNANAQLALVSKEDSKFKSRMGSIPRFERDYINLLRDKEIKNGLYIFLLEKRESARLKLMSTAAPGFVVDKAHSDLKPNNNKKLIVIALAFLLTLIAPTIWILILLARKNVVRKLFDVPAKLEANGVEYAGEASLGALRNMLLSENTIFIKPLDHSDVNVAQELANSFEAVEIPAKVFDASASEDEILKNSVLSAINSSDGKALVSLPASYNLPKVDGALVLVAKAGVTKRRQLIKLVENYKGSLYGIIV